MSQIRLVTNVTSTRIGRVTCSPPTAAYGTYVTASLANTSYEAAGVVASSTSFEPCRRYLAPSIGRFLLSRAIESPSLQIRPQSPSMTRLARLKTSRRSRLWLARHSCRPVFQSCTFRRPSHSRTLSNLKTLHNLKSSLPQPVSQQQGNSLLLNRCPLFYQQRVAFAIFCVHHYTNSSDPVHPT